MLQTADGLSIMTCDCFPKISLILDTYSTGLKNKCTNMELASQAKKKDLDDVSEKLKESLSDADDNRRLLIERDNLVDQLKDDKVKYKKELGESEQKVKYLNLYSGI